MLQLPPIARDGLRAHIREKLADDEAARVAALLTEADASGMDAARVAADAAALIEAIREQQRYRAGINALLTEYSLSSREGVVLMCLAEALLRVPDKLTADRLIRDKIGSGDWRSHVGSSSSLFVNASAWGLLLTGKVIQLRREDSESAWRMLRQTVGRAGEPAIRAAMRLAMKIMGTQFVHGTDVFEAMEKSREWQERGYRYSYDMLGEGARDSGYALEYFEGYREAIKQVGIRAGARDPVSGPGFSVKLSALHPRMELAQGARLAHELVPRVLELARLAREHRIGLTIDAEEAHRLDLTLDLFEAVYLDRSLAGWDGFGIVVQTYLKSAPAVIDWLADLATRGARRIMVRLVKGAYWDAEIKHAQALGHAGYPVFTRKASSDLSYLVCAQRLLARRDRLYPQFATHNAHSAAAVLALAGRDTTGFEFQRLHGMGEELYEELLERRASKVPCRIYAPVGVHRDLLAYLVRRLLENGANSSFVHNIANEELPSQLLAADPRDKLRGLRHYANRGIPLPAAIFGAARQNARGVDLQGADELMEFAAGLDAWRESAARLGCAASAPGAIAVHNPANHAELLGHYRMADTAAIDAVMRTARAGAAPWAATPVAERAACLRRAAQRMETALPELVGFCVKEAGKTLRDALADVREAIDFCRYYAAEAESLLGEGAALAPRGPILCISPWNFPVAIFTGQVAAALVAGNPVIAKPAEQTTLVALRLVEMLHAAGVPPSALGVLCGPGEPVGARLLGDPHLAGVMFTGSTEVARLIARALAARDGPRAMLIAETGGQNAMVVDSTALPEQVVDDVIASGFNSAGQRCSALRVLFVQHDIAERLIAMLRGAMDELRIGDPTDCATDIGPIIDNEARARLEAHLAWLDGNGRLLHRCTLDEDTAAGSFLAPCLYEIESIEALPREVFGPVVHLVRYHAEELESLPARINATGYGLTFGVHSRIQSTVDFLARELDVGNVYVNRNIIGAVVGVQPFGGHGLSGTGPKAGGPLYLPRLLRPVAATPGAAHPLDMTPAAAPDPGFDCQGALAALAEAQAEWGRTAMRERFGPARTLYEQLARDPAREALAQMTRALLGQAGGLAQPRELPGPTGESNTLSFHARGVIACLAREGSRIEDVLLPALAALLAGNAVLFLSGAGARAQVMQVRELLAEAGFADDLSTHQTCPDVAALIEVLRGGALDGAACHADTPLAAVASGALAARTSAILPLVEEPFGPCYLARFLKEKTLSVNITASGGNAALMSQSESDE